MTTAKEESNDASADVALVNGDGKIGIATTEFSLHVNDTTVPLAKKGVVLTSTFEPSKVPTSHREYRDHVPASEEDRDMPARRNVFNLQTDIKGVCDADVTFAHHGKATTPGARTAASHGEASMDAATKAWLKSRDARMRGAVAVALEMEHAVANLAYERNDLAVAQVRERNTPM